MDEADLKECVNMIEDVPLVDHLCGEDALCLAVSLAFSVSCYFILWSSIECDQ
jgi:hypothetical protein